MKTSVSHAVQKMPLLPAVLLFVLCFNFLWFAQPSISLSQSSKSPAPQSIKIGYSVVATDPAGPQPLKAARMAAAEINAAGGVLGRPLEIMAGYLPNKDYTKLPPVINGFMSKGATCVITSGGSAMTLKATEITIPANVLLMTASSSSPKITELKDNDLVWRTIPSDVFQGKVAAKLMDSLKHKRVGIIHVDHPYGNGLASVFTAEFQKRGGKVVADVSYKESLEYKDVDFAPMLKKLYQEKPDAVYMITYGEDGATIINQSFKGKLLDEKGYKPFFLGCDANYNTDFSTGVDSWNWVNGMMGLSYVHPKNYANFESFFKRFQEFNPPQDSADIANANLATLLSLDATKSYAATAYDAVYLLALAMSKAQSTDAKKIASELRNLSRATKSSELVNVGEYAKALALLRQGKELNYDGASGLLEFDEHGDVTSGSYNVWQLSKGEFVETGVMEIGMSGQATSAASKQGEKKK
jgi:ABC-type branched-subunit amino acid transport system substrate-binding protein